MKKYLYSLICILLIGVVGYSLTYHTKQPVTVDIPTKTYVAMGDSVAAGVGLKDNADPSACDRTNESYPAVVAKAMNYALSNIACSGATVPVGITGSQTVNQLDVSSQLDALFALKRPDLITITVGANDAGWTQNIGKCYSGECGSDTDTAAVATRLASMKTNLSAALMKIKQHFGTNQPKVIVTGYYQVFPSTAMICSDLTGIDASELAWGRQQQAALSEAVKEAIPSETLDQFVPIEFTGHELCSAEPWVQGLGDKQPYHPTAAGQAAIAKAVVFEVNSNQ